MVRNPLIRHYSEILFYLEPLSGLQLILQYSNFIPMRATNITHFNLVKRKHLLRILEGCAYSS
jgi:hypothetical protein